ncbi:MAG TPA: response regulator transcription factor [Candidatus Angelobacter sp.]|nr:response regulator transcription factor [Candidatus Angelobacter sp.]
MMSKNDAESSLYPVGSLTSQQVFYAVSEGGKDDRPIQQPPGKRRILLADDHCTMLKRLVSHLEPFFEVVAAVSNGIDLISEVRRLGPELIVTDITMPGLTGIEAVRELRRTGSLIPVVFLTVHREAAFVEACLTEGALGYVHKSGLVSELIPAMIEALSGRRFISPSVPYAAELHTNSSS